MAAASSEQDTVCLVGVNDGDFNANAPISCPCFQILNPSFDDVNQHYSVDVLPVYLEDGSLPMRLNCPLHSSQGQDVYSISLLPEEDSVDTDCASQLAALGLLEVQEPCKDRMCLDAQLDCEDFVDYQVESLDAYSPCIVDIDIEKDNYGMLKSNNEKHGSMNNEGLLSNMNRVLRRQVSLKTGQKLMQLLMDNSTMLLKFSSKERPVTERAHDMSNNRWRRYKRAASFDSRKVVILFSILSSLGTLVLIYLTLKVRQNGDASTRNW
ncbi:uncharacterized protein LOC116201187 isoform X1 [Punica granatum]|uniref:Uncharacterized protein LOC116201187 isoform X1 n=2 Tax=Punica granatum TaxID=22663 RepID=A0A6P8D1A2_PUNGR|nr:uncharacterized protein LOC116201187 isoform X1 [Punica granatum]PKI66225.1 hypothetical protein CRG98_013393 [Punica granatum]